MKKFFQIIIVIFILIISPIFTYSAEILQINDPKTIVVGDQNRFLYLSLYCIEINNNDKNQAIKILKKNFPRGTKVKIKPYGTTDNRLLAKIFKIDDNSEMTDLLNTYNSSNKNCVN